MSVPTDAERKVPWRTLTCRECGELEDVLELPHPYLDADDFVCALCLRPVKPPPVPYGVIPY